MVCVFKHLYCPAQLSMSDMEKRYRNKIIIIIIIMTRTLVVGSSPVTGTLVVGLSPVTGTLS